MPVSPARAVAPDSVRWCLRLLDAPQLVRADGAEVKRLSAKDAALLALVALDGPLDAARVAALVWPTATGPKADASLRQRLFRLRRETGATLVETGTLLKLAPDLQTGLELTHRCWRP